MIAPISPDGQWHYLVTGMIRNRPNTMVTHVERSTPIVDEASVTDVRNTIADQAGGLRSELTITNVTLLSVPDGGQLARIRDGLLAAKRLPAQRLPAALDTLISMIEQGWVS